MQRIGIGNINRIKYLPSNSLVFAPTHETLALLERLDRVKGGLLLTLANLPRERYNTLKRAAQQYGLVQWHIFVIALDSLVYLANVHPEALVDIVAGVKQEFPLRPPYDPSGDDALDGP